VIFCHASQNRYLVGFKRVLSIKFYIGMIGNHIATISLVFFFRKKATGKRELCLKLPQFIKKYHMIKKNYFYCCCLLSSLIQFLLKLSNLELSNVELRQLLLQNRVDYRKPDGVKTGDIMIVTIAQKREMTITCFNRVDISCWCWYWRKRVSKLGGRFVKIAADDDLLWKLHSHWAPLKRL
jgi:hypothetical protein